jgi:hypothetical protein
MPILSALGRFRLDVIISGTSTIKKRLRMGRKLDAAKAELGFAKTAVERMRNAPTLAEFDFQWKEFLGRTTRVWNKTEADLKGDPRFYNSPHVTRVKDARKKDDLIRYAARARDADEHTADPITGEMDAGPEYTFTFPDGNYATIRNPTATIDGKTFPIGAWGHSAERFAPAEVYAMPVTVRGQTYDVPTRHRDDAITGLTLIRFAELTLSFYEEFIDDLQRDGWDR